MIKLLVIFSIVIAIIFGTILSVLFTNIPFKNHHKQNKTN